MVFTNGPLAKATAFSPPEVINDARKQIDQEVVALKICRNKLAITSRLPVEILSYIFIVNAQSYLTPSFFSVGNRLPPRNLIWIAVSHVCHHWREVAMTTPRLWIHLPVFNSRWTEEMLIRSRPMSVVYEIDMNCRAISEVKIDPLRAREVHLSGTLLRIRESLEKVVEPAPALEKITLTLTQVTGGTYGPPIDLSRVIAPRLHALHTRCCISGLNAPQLTSLSIHHSPLVRLTTTLTQLLAVLEGLPSLRDLSLRHAFEVASDSYLRRPPVILAHLQYLDLRHTTRGCSQLLTDIISLTAFNLAIGCNEPCTTSGFSTLLSALGDHVSAVQNPILLRCLWIGMARRLDYSSAIPSFKDCNLRLGGWTRLLRGNYVNEFAHPQIGFDLSWSDSEHVDCGDLLVSLCQLVHRDAVEILQIDFGDTEPLPTMVAPVSAWARGLDDMMPVHTLRVCCDDWRQMSHTSGLFLAIKGIQQNSSAETDEQRQPGPSTRVAPRQHALLPGLRVFIFEGVDFTGDLYPDHQSFFGVLKDILRARMGSGVNSMQVIIEHCVNVTEEHISQLEEIVGDVTWDGEEVSRDCETSAIFTPSESSDLDSTSDDADDLSFVCPATEGTTRPWLWDYTEEDDDSDDSYFPPSTSGH